MVVLIICLLLKVKCTGEHDGCARCRNLNTECVYAESRVGKVQGSRSKRRKTHSRTMETDPGTQVHDELSAKSKNGSVTLPTPIFSPHSPMWPGNDTRTTQHQNVFSWANSWNNNTPWDFDMSMITGNVPNLHGSMVDGSTLLPPQLAIAPTGFQDTTHSSDNRDVQVNPEGQIPVAASSSSIVARGAGSSGVTQSSVTAATRPTVLPDLGGRLEDPRQHDEANDNSDSDDSSSVSRSSRSSSVELPPAGETSGTSITSDSKSSQVHLPERTLRSGPKPSIADFGRLNSHCVLSCVRVIGTLENYLLGELKNLDLIMEIISRAGAEVSNLVKLQQEARCDRCVLLFNTVVFQLIELLDAGARALSDVQKDFPGASLYPAGFGFGSLSHGPEDQRLWRSRVMRGACHRVGDLISGVIGLVRLGPRGESLAPEAVEQRVKCLVAMERKLKCIYDREGGEDSVAVAQKY